MTIFALLGPAATAALVFLSTLQPMHIETIARKSIAPNGAAAFGWVECEEGPGHVDHIVVYPTRGVLTHELMHAVDCADNGRLDGSPLPVSARCHVPDCAHAWVYWAMDHDSEAADIIAGMTHGQPFKYAITTGEHR